VPGLPPLAKALAQLFADSFMFQPGLNGLLNAMILQIDDSQQSRLIVHRVVFSFQDVSAIPRLHPQPQCPDNHIEKVAPGEIRIFEQGVKFLAVAFTPQPRIESGQIPRQIFHASPRRFVPILTT
jgi:hypothetical protein